ncbi:MAG: helix-turn-helix domain-containing protein [candidate division Zixibacteria bacterium]|nr:helix-turn-helix domain-containing protein [candidate division Zixibacteria bacterium]MBU1469783.1 helix-turn-helix domain-containing protein [candidate division Zixibacteria bacterium]MBU2626478.1 helix-turn-helix domain-containing protein [candidate division Zixibacteria bacterium]
MANQLKVALADAIIGLLACGWSYRRIARELGVHRETVARYDRLRVGRGSKPAKAIPGSSWDSDPKPANAIPGSSDPELPDCSLGPPSLCKSFEALIKKKLDYGLSGQRIWQDLVSEDGFTGSYSSVRRFVRRLGQGTPLPFRRMECEPGQEAQVDFGSGAWIVSEDGRKRRAHVLRIILSHSRKGYSEAVLRQTTENFIRALENAFQEKKNPPCACGLVQTAPVRC